MSISCSTPSCSTPSFGPPTELRSYAFGSYTQKIAVSRGVMIRSCWSACSAPAARTRVISRYDWSAITNSPWPTPCPPVPPMVPSHQVRTGLFRYRWTLKSIATVAGSGTFLNQTGEPFSSTMSGPHRPVPEAGVRQMYPGTVAFAAVVIVTSGNVRRSGLDRYFGGAAWAASLAPADVPDLSD